MSQKLVSFELSSQESFYYSALKKYGETGYDDAEHWPVEKYDDSQKTIIFKKVEASIDDVLEFAKLLQRWLISACERLEKIDSKEEHRQLIKKDNIEFVVEGTAEYSFAGENCRFRIEVKGEAITIQQSDNFIFFGSMYFSDYDKFCATKTIICDDLSKLCSKEEFNTAYEYCVTHDKLYVNEFPPYGKKTPADKHMKAGVIYSFDDTTAKKISNGESLEDEEKAVPSANENTEMSNHYQRINDLAEENGEACGILIENQPLANIIANQVTAFTFSEQQKKLLQGGCFLFYADECNICPRSLSDVLDRLAEILDSGDGEFFSIIEKNRKLLERSFNLVYWTRITFDLTDTPEDLLCNMADDVYKDYRERFFGLDSPKVPNAEQMDKIQLISTPEFVEFMIGHLVNDSSNFRRREEFVYFECHGYYLEVLEYRDINFPETFLNNVRSKSSKSDIASANTTRQQSPKTITVQKKETANTIVTEKAKSSSFRQHTDQESLQIKRELKKVLSSGQVITISEMQAQSSFLSKYTNFKLSGMLREMREIGEIDKIYDCMKNACYGTPAAIERVRPEIEKEIARREEVRKAKEEERVAEENRQRERVFRDADNALKSYSKQSVQKSISDLEKLPDKKNVPDKIRALNRRLDELEAEERQKQEEERQKRANKTKTTIVIVGMIVVIAAILFFFM